MNTWVEMDEPSRAFCTNLALESRNKGRRSAGKAGLGQGHTAQVCVELLRAEASSHMAPQILLTFVFMPREMGSPWRLNWSDLYHKKGAFDAVWRTDFFLLGGERNWKLGVHLGSGSCSSGGQSWGRGCWQWGWREVGRQGLYWIEK